MRINSVVDSLFTFFVIVTPFRSTTNFSNSIVNSFAELGNQGWEYVGDTSISKTDLTATWSFAVFKKPI
jgi:hypothetical protein